MTERTPKPLLEIDDQPIIGHIMENFHRHGFGRFVLCTGYKSEAFVEHFRSRKSEYTDGGSVLSSSREFAGVGPGDWDVTVVDTGLETSITGRLVQLEEYIDADRFFVTYGDSLADVDVGRLLDRHREADTLATVTGVQARSSFGVLETDGDSVRSIQEKPLTTKRINAGFFVFETGVFEHLTEQKHFTQDFLDELAAAGELTIHRHDGFFRGIDTIKDLQQIRDLAADQQRPPWVGVDE